MKKLLTLAIIAGSIGFSAFSAEAKISTANELTATNTSEPQIRIRLGQNRRRNNRRIRRVITQARNIRVGRRLYRETYRTTYLPNGRVTTRIISRVRIR